MGIVTGVLVVAGALAVGLGISLLFAFPVEWAWNYVMPTLFGLKEIDWGQAFCLNFLASTLIKSTTSLESKD